MNLPADPRAAADQAIAEAFKRDQFPDDYKPVPDAPVPMEDEMSEAWRYLPPAGKLHARMVFGDGVAVFKVEPSDHRGHLMAAAPVLLEALRRVLASQTIKNPDPDSDPDVIFARAAIAKATGNA